MRKLLLYIIILFAFIFTSNESRSQTNLEITSINVINDQGHVKITWDYNGTKGLDILRNKNDITTSIHEINDLSIASNNLNPSMDSLTPKQSLKITLPVFLKLCSAMAISK